MKLLKCKKIIKVKMLQFFYQASTAKSRNMSNGNTNKKIFY